MKTEYTGEKKTRIFFASEKNRLKRLAFAREHVHWDREQWKSVVWSDESQFTLQYNFSQITWRSDREKKYQSYNASDIKTP